MNTPTIPREELKEKLEAWAKKINHLAHSTNHPDWNEKADILRACLTELERWEADKLAAYHSVFQFFSPAILIQAAGATGQTIGHESYRLKYTGNQLETLLSKLRPTTITTNQQEAE